MRRCRGGGEPGRYVLHRNPRQRKQNPESSLAVAVAAAGTVVHGKHLQVVAGSS